MTHLEKIKEFTSLLGIDLSKWELEYDQEKVLYGDDDEHREVIYRNINDGTYSLYIVVQYFKSKTWEIIELSLTGD